MFAANSPVATQLLLRALDSLLARAGDNPIALLQLAQALQSQGHDKRAREVVRQALSIAGDDPEVVVGAAEIASHGIPRWHFSIVRDEVRNSAYDAALQRVIRPGMRVLDIGSGTGLLAMMAARAGAAEVITCEMNSAVAEACEEVVARNGFGSRIRVINKHSLDLDASADLGGRVDLLVSEIIGNDMLCEGVLPAHEHAVQRLLKPQAPVIPARGTIRVALAEDRRLVHKRMSTAAGFDLTPFNRLAPVSYRVAADAERIVLKSEPANLVSFDFQSGGPYRPAREEILTRAEQGGVNGILQWIQLDLDEIARYESFPLTSTATGWAPIFHPLPEALRPQQGERLTIHCAHYDRTLRIWGKRT